MYLYSMDSGDLFHTVIHRAGGLNRRSAVGIQRHFSRGFAGNIRALVLGAVLPCVLVRRVHPPPFVAKAFGYTYTRMHSLLHQCGSTSWPGQQVCRAEAR